MEARSPRREAAHRTRARRAVEHFAAIGSSVAHRPRAPACRPGRRGRALAASLALIVALAAGCGAGDESASTRVDGDTLTVYSSVPRHGVSAAAGDAVFAGQRRALERAGGRAGGRRVRLVRLSSTTPGDVRWDPGSVEANAERAREDPSAIAYLGELDNGGSAVSLPVTNGAGLLQVSPTDGLTSLTRASPGRPRAGPERYYPEELHNFARLVPNDLVVADQLVARLRSRRVGRVAILHREGIAERELAATLVQRLIGGGIEPTFVEPLRDDDDDAASEAAAELVGTRPQAVIYLGVGGATTASVLAALAAAAPRLPVLAGAGVLADGAPAGPSPRDLTVLTPVLPGRAQPAAGRRVLSGLARERGAPVRPEALYGYASMGLVLAAIERAGPDRRGVVRAALAPAARSTVLGRMSLRPSGDVESRRLALLRVSDGEVALERVLPER